MSEVLKNQRKIAHSWGSEVRLALCQLQIFAEFAALADLQPSTGKRKGLASTESRLLKCLAEQDKR